MVVFLEIYIYEIYIELSIGGQEKSSLFSSFLLISREASWEYIYFFNIYINRSPKIFTSGFSKGLSV